MKYFAYKGYRFASRTLAVSMILSFIVLFLSKDVRSTGQFSDPYIVAVLVSLISGISVYAASLIVSKVSERSRLKLAGTLLLLQGVTLLSSVIWALNSTTFMLGGALTKVERWASLLTIPAHVLFAVNFAQEKTTAKDPDKAGGESLATTMRVVGFASICFGLFLACDW